MSQTLELQEGVVELSYANASSFNLWYFIKEILTFNVNMTSKSKTHVFRNDGGYALISREIDKLEC